MYAYLVFIALITRNGVPQVVHIERQYATQEACEASSKHLYNNMTSNEKRSGAYMDIISNACIR